METGAYLELAVRAKVTQILGRLFYRYDRGLESSENLIKDGEHDLMDCFRTYLKLYEA